MSSKGIYSAVSGAMAQSSRLDTIANNLANVNTTSFKKDRQVFSEYLSAHEKNDPHINVPRVPASIESFYDMQGGDNAYVNPAGTYTNFEQGVLRSTGSAFDVAIEGKGFLEVLTPQGVRWTRNGALQIDGNGRLTTKEGHPVLRDGQNDPAQRIVQLVSGNVTISRAGDVFDGGNNVGKLALVDFQVADDLQKVGGSMYQLKSNAVSQPQIARDARIHQGFVEGSNVNVIEEMTDMITANRVFEATQQAIKGHDQMDDKLINQVGKV
ncbi:MAG TPA: flagellar basal-body rod protein FlgF [Bdellovibrionales bacterium]|nr:flagellar basal-body rod protein FlgF [Bdellovibrionales bacterium]